MSEGSKPATRWTDSRLIERCITGDEDAWNSLVGRYRNLTFAVILRYGVKGDDAADLFQAVWLDVHNDLPNLRKRDALKSWLITLTRRKCYHWQQRQRLQHRYERPEQEEDHLESQATLDPSILEELQRDQLVREAIRQLPERCSELIRMLFFRQPPLPYQQVADELGLAVGSIGFIRGRCLKKLQKALESLGLKD